MPGTQEEESRNPGQAPTEGAPPQEGKQHATTPAEGGQAQETEQPAGPAQEGAVEEPEQSPAVPGEETAPPAAEGMNDKLDKEQHTEQQEIRPIHVLPPMALGKRDPVLPHLERNYTLPTDQTIHNRIPLK